MGDADFLVFGEVGLFEEVGEGSVALVDPFGCLFGTDAVDSDEFLQDSGVWIYMGVVEAS